MEGVGFISPDVSEVEQMMSAIENAKSAWSKKMTCFTKKTRLQVPLKKIGSLDLAKFDPFTVAVWTVLREFFVL